MSNSLPFAIVDEESATQPGDRVSVVTRCASLEAAEAWIAAREKVDPEKVHRGGYGIDGPDCG